MSKTSLEEMMHVREVLRSRVMSTKAVTQGTEMLERYCQKRYGRAFSTGDDANAHIEVRRFRLGSA